MMESGSLSFSLHSSIHMMCVCVCNLLTQIDVCNENISRKTAQVEEHSKAEAEAKVRAQQPYLMALCPTV